MTIVVFYIGMIVQTLTLPIGPGECAALIMSDREIFEELWGNLGLRSERIELRCVDHVLVVMDGEPA